jgi:hypothetical protein
LWVDSEGSFTFHPGGVDVRIAPHAHAQYTFMARANIWSGPLPVLKFDVTAGGLHHVFTKDLIIRRNYLVHKAVVIPTVDGELDEWAGIPQVVLADSRDAAPVARVQTVWNKGSLWIAASIRRDRPSREPARRANPLNDAFIVGIDRNLTRSETGNEDLQIEVSRDSNGIVLYDRAHGDQLHPAESGISAAVADAGDSAVVYELKLSAAFLHPLELRRNAHFGIDFAVITPDSAGGRQLISWTPGIGYDGFDASFKSQAHFAEAELK